MFASGKYRLLSFDGDDIAELAANFKTVIDEYLKDCAERGVKGEQPKVSASAQRRVRLTVVIFQVTKNLSIHSAHTSADSCPPIALRNRSLRSLLAINAAHVPHQKLTADILANFDTNHVKSVTIAQDHYN